MLANIVLAIGIALVSIGLWEVKRLRNESKQEFDNIRAIKQEIYQAKSDVEKLLLELNKASERAVQDFMIKIEESNSVAFQMFDSQEKIAVTEQEKDELKGQIAMAFSGVDPYKIPDKQMLVLQLAEQGLTPAQIAQKINIGKGEVILILNLHTRGERDVQVLQ